MGSSVDLKPPKEVINILENYVSPISFWSESPEERLLKMKEKADAAVKEYEDCKAEIEAEKNRVDPVKHWLEAVKNA